MNDCGAAAKGDWFWDDHFCLQCEGVIVAWPYSTDVRGTAARTPHSGIAQRARAAHREGRRAPTAEEVLSAGGAVLSLLQDCLAADGEPDPDVLSHVLGTGEATRRDVEYLVQRPPAPGVNSEETLSRLLDLHTVLAVSLEAARSRQAAVEPSRHSAQAGSENTASLAAAEARLETESNRGRPAKMGVVASGNGGGGAARNAESDGTNRGTDATEPAATASSGWSADARAAFEARIGQGLAEAGSAPRQKPAPVGAPAVMQASEGNSAASDMRKGDAEEAEQLARALATSALDHGVATSSQESPSTGTGVEEGRGQGDARPGVE